ncbi:transglycosylase SLT domain-containing protein [Bacillus inaquosorum]|uniref:transglycosylase SLT domain-containing protein n=1 Tax=Bacillus inaquosorum TaxID=483913 RepID=UPI00227E9FCC|nr:transglycosylase SLT domain-containing protein [Bacillus inaquosorum]MCY8163118.1 transglycosylase SLT domain-containing protein [Bacillus inaquosorum]MCY8321092.1 transglycosylase SLT domain-containing protein [Bacillus inaquosorum]MCY8336633.1 transglycosylase SLT domain-containing protein [Bacillus inaquosorum]
MSDALRSTHIDVELNVDTSPLERANQQIDRLVDHVGDAGGSFSQMRTRMAQVQRQQRNFRDIHMSMILDNSSLQTASQTIERLGPQIDLVTSRLSQLNTQVQETSRLIQSLPSEVNINVDQTSITNANESIDQLRQNLNNVDMSRIGTPAANATQQNTQSVQNNVAAVAVPAPDYRGIRQYNREMNFLRGSTQGLEEDTIRMLNEMRQAWYNEHHNMSGFRNEMIRAQYGFFQLGNQMDSWSGTNQQFMDEVYRLGRAHKQVTDNMMKNNKMMRMSMLQTVGTLMARSTQSEKIAANYDRMGNPLYQVNKAGLAVSNTLENMAKQGTAAHLALKMLGPTANMKELNDMTMMITQGYMRFQMVALGAAFTNFFMFQGLHKAATQTVPGYSKAWEEMCSTLLKAIQPAIEVFAAFAMAIYKGITAVAKLIIQFNEAHPVLSKMIQGFMLLIPVLTLLLSPLAIGVGLVNGFLGALSSLWMFIGPVVTGLAAMSGTVYVVAGAIVLLVTGIYLLYKNFDKLQERFKPATDAMKRFANMGKSAVVGAFHTMIKEAEGLKSAFMKGFKDAQSVAISAIHKMQAESLKLWDRLGESHPQLVAGIESAYKTAVKTVSGFIHNAGKTVSDFFGKGLSDGLNGIVTGFMEQLKVGLSSFKGMVSLVAPFVAAIGLAFLGVSGPIGIAVGAILSVAGALYRMQQTNQNVSQALKTAWTSVQSVLTTVFQALQPIINTIQQSFGQLVTQLTPQFQQLAGQLQQAFVQIGGTLVLFAASISQTFQTIGPQIMPLIQQLLSAWMKLSGTLWTSVLQIASSILPLLVQGFQTIFPVILSVINAVLPIIIQLIGSFSGILVSIVQNALPVLVQMIQLAFPLILSIIQQALPIVLQLIQLLGSSIGQIAVQVLPLILSAVQQVFPIIKQVIMAVLPIVAQLLTVAATIILQLAQAALPILIQVVQQVFPQIMQIIQAALPIVVSLLQFLANIITTVVIPAIRFILNIVTAVFPVVLSIIQVALKNIIAIIQGAIGIIMGIVKVFKGLFTGNFRMMWDGVKQIFSSAVGMVKKLVSNMGAAITDRWLYIKNKVALLAFELRKKVMNRFNDLVEGAKKLPGRIGDGIKNMAHKAVSGVTSLANKLAGALGKGVNGVIGGVNWVLDKIGLKDKHIPKWEVPKYAHGTGGHPGGPAILGDGKGANAGPEMYRTPSGHVGLSPATDTLMNLPKGTEVLSAKQTRAALAGVPAYAKGTEGNIFTKAWNGVKSVAGKVKDVALDVFDYIGHPSKLLTKVLEKMGVSAPSMAGSFGDLAKGAFNFVKDKAVGFVKDKMSSYSASFSGGGSKAVKKWVAQALSIKGLGPEYAGALETIAMKESGGNPNVVNNWDSNAKAGHPSQGLMQFIPSTFNAHKETGHGNIKNPVDQILAAINYLNSRYGGILKHPGLVSMAHGGPYRGYATGGVINSPQVAALGENGFREYVITTEPRYRNQSLGMYAALGRELGADTGYTPEKAATSSSTSSVNITFNPSINVKVEGGSEGAETKVKKAVTETFDEVFDMLKSLYPPEGAY